MSQAIQPQPKQPIQKVADKIANHFKSLQLGKKYGDLKITVRFRDGKPVFMTDAFEETTKFE